VPILVSGRLAFSADRGPSCGKCSTSHDRGEAKQRHLAPRRIRYGPEERRPRRLPECYHQERKTQAEIWAVGKHRYPPHQESAARYDIGHAEQSHYAEGHHRSEGCGGEPDQGQSHDEQRHAIDRTDPEAESDKAGSSTQETGGAQNAPGERNPAIAKPEIVAHDAGAEGPDRGAGGAHQERAGAQSPDSRTRQVFK
jgi:hypothetical protein